jgi:hypothetical protein
MNERIKELAEQAGWDMGDEVDGFTIRLEKFAELIIKQCISVCHNGSLTRHSYEERLYVANDIIKSFMGEKNEQ